MNNTPPVYLSKEGKNPYMQNENKTRAGKSFRQNTESILFDLISLKKKFHTTIIIFSNKT